MKKIADSNLIRLLGTWKTTGTVKSEKENLPLIGTDTYELILDGNYILHKAAVKIGEDHSETFEMIMLDESTNSAVMFYFDNKGENGKMRCSIEDDTFKIDGDELKFEGIINHEDTKISGHWFSKEENAKWEVFIDLKLEKQ